MADAMKLSDLVLHKAPLRATASMIEVIDAVSDGKGHIRCGAGEVWRLMFEQWLVDRAASPPAREEAPAEVITSAQLIANTDYARGAVRVPGETEDRRIYGQPEAPAEGAGDLETAWRILESIPAINDLGSQYQEDIQSAILSALRNRTSEPEAGAIDDLVDRFAAALKDKLHAAEAKYGHDDAWMRDDWQTDLVRDLQRHVEKGDPRDVAAYCAFAWHHGWSTSDASEHFAPNFHFQTNRDQIAKCIRRAVGDAWIGECQAEVAADAVLNLRPATATATADKLREAAGLLNDCIWLDTDTGDYRVEHDGSVEKARAILAALNEGGE